MKNLKKITLAALGIIAVTTLAACGSSQSKNSTSVSSDSKKIKITLATDGSTPPFAYHDNSGNLTGYDIEVEKAVFAKLPQYEVTWTTTDFNSVIAGINNGRFTAVANDIAWTKEREPLYYFSSPLSLSSDAVAVKSGNYEKLSDLAGKSTEGLASSNYSALIKSYNEQNPSKQIKLNYVDANYSLASRLNDVATGKTDFILYDQISLEQVNKQTAAGLKIQKIDDNAGDEHNGYEYMIFQKNDQGKELQTNVNKVLKELQADGTLKKLSEKYLGGDYVPAASKFN